MSLLYVLVLTKTVPFSVAAIPVSVATGSSPVVPVSKVNSPVTDISAYSFKFEFTQTIESFAGVTKLFGDTNIFRFVR